MARCRPPLRRPPRSDPLLELVQISPEISARSRRDLPPRAQVALFAFDAAAAPPAPRDSLAAALAMMEQADLA